MRVLFVTHNFPRAPGDLPGSFVLRLAHALIAHDHDVRVLAPHAPGAGTEDIIEGVRVTRYRYAPDARETLAYAGTMAAQVASSFRAKLDLLEMIRAGARGVAARRADVDIVHAHWWFPSGASAARVRARPLVTTLHGSDVRLARGAIPRLWMRRVLGRSSRVTAVSSWLADAALAAGAPQRPAVAPMPVETDLFTPADAVRNGVLFVGKLDAQKGPHVLLEALSRLPTDVTATFVGDGPDARMLHARAADLGVAGRVRWCGALPHRALPAYYRSARLVVAPATEPEGLGLVAAEALLCETPVIASRIGGLTDVVSDSETGLLVPPSDAAALARAITTALEAPDRGSAWGREGRARVLERFSPAACGAAYDAIYREAVRAAA